MFGGDKKRATVKWFVLSSNWLVRVQGTLAVNQEVVSNRWCAFKSCHVCFTRLNNSVTIQLSSDWVKWEAKKMKWFMMMQLSLKLIHNCQSAEHVQHISAQRWEMCIANINFLMICVAEGSSLVKQAEFLITLYNYQLSRQRKMKNILWPAFRVALSIKKWLFKAKKIFSQRPRDSCLNDTSEILVFVTLNKYWKL